jgi:hypothetical protein
MRIVRGGSAETKDNRWVKFDIELDESDLQGETVKYNLADLTVIQKYTLLTKLAELLVTVRMETLGVKGEHDSASLNEAYKVYVSTLPRADD